MFSKALFQDPCDFTLFGTLGDLSCRKILPALYELENAQLIHPSTRIIGCARDDLSSQDYLAWVKTKLQLFVKKPLDEGTWARLKAKMSYCQLDFMEHADYTKLVKENNPSDRVAIFYFAIPPTLYAHTCHGLSIVGLTKQSARLVLEKPIGQDLISSVEINDQVAHFFNEDQIYRIDHYLGKESVLNLLALRFANSVFSSNWDHRIIDKVEITVAEEIGVEGRWDYYDKAGHARDMLQNHMLQILALIAMEPPLSLSAEDIRSEKLKVLKSLRSIGDTNAHDDTVRGQYAEGVVNGQKVPGYLDEEGAIPGSTTETFVAVKTHIDNWRWSGVPFYLLTGKKLSKKQSTVVIYFKPQPHNIFQQANDELVSNQLIIRLQPDEGVELRIMNKVPGLSGKMQLQSSKLDLNFNNNANSHRIADAYERLVLEVMLGNQYLFVSREEIEHAWKWIDGIKVAWERQNSPLYPYASGSWGPDEVKRLYENYTHVEDVQNATS